MVPPWAVLLTVIREGTGKCSISSPDLPSLAFFFCKTSLVGRGCKKDINMASVYTTVQSFPYIKINSE